MTALHLPPVDVAARTGRLRARFAGAGIDALLVTRLPNVRYLTGFTGSAAFLLVGPDELVFVSDGRYRDQAAEQLGAAGVDARIEIRTAQADQRTVLADAARGVARLGLEAHGVTWAQQRAFAGEWFPDAELVATEHLVEELRRVKDDGEVARIRTACAIADEALAAVTPTFADGPTERDVALALDLEMRRRGASGVSFDPIVASGPNGAKPHARPSERRIEPNELVVIDFGCIVDGYCSDMTRTVSVGDPGAEARRVYDVVLDSQRTGRAAVRAGADCAAVDKACRDVIAAAGWGDAFVHGTGHGVGLEIHEAPRVAATARDTLASGYVVTVEPGVYLSGVGGVRIEDTVVVTDEGADALTASPKELVL
ncbi:MAG TPA: Xaa-Pro peptidase family protein [Acidimicrobiia bacterium]|nr:Xaa-Pro peptidase family protein [Acidimicrobiia bacterium]